MTWTAVTRIPIDDVTSTVDHFIPGIGIDPATSGATAHVGNSLLLLFAKQLHRLRPAS